MIFNTTPFKSLLTLATLSLILTSCAAGAVSAATAGYSVRSGTSDDLSSAARDSLIKEAVRQSKEYTDTKLQKKSGDSKKSGTALDSAAADSEE